jgi:hypothetical protein
VLLWLSLWWGLALRLLLLALVLLLVAQLRL